MKKTITEKYLGLLKEENLFVIKSIKKICVRRKIGVRFAHLILAHSLCRLEDGSNPHRFVTISKKTDSGKPIREKSWKKQALKYGGVEELMKQKEARRRVRELEAEHEKMLALEKEREHAIGIANEQRSHSDTGPVIREPSGPEFVSPPPRKPGVVPAATPSTPTPKSGALVIYPTSSSSVGPVRGHPASSRPPRSTMVQPHHRPQKENPRYLPPTGRPFQNSLPRMVRPQGPGYYPEHRLANYGLENERRGGNVGFRGQPYQRPWPDRHRDHESFTYRSRAMDGFGYVQPKAESMHETNRVPNWLPNDWEQERMRSQPCGYDQAVRPDSANEYFPPPVYDWHASDYCYLARNNRDNEHEEMSNSSTSGPSPYGYFTSNTSNECSSDASMVSSAHNNDHRTAEHASNNSEVDNNACRESAITAASSYAHNGVNNRNTTEGLRPEDEYVPRFVSSNGTDSPLPMEIYTPSTAQTVPVERYFNNQYSAEYVPPVVKRDPSLPLDDADEEKFIPGSRGSTESRAHNDSTSFCGFKDGPGRASSVPAFNYPANVIDNSSDRNASIVQIRSLTPASSSGDIHSGGHVGKHPRATFSPNRNTGSFSSSDDSQDSFDEQSQGVGGKCKNRKFSKTTEYADWRRRTTESPLSIRNLPEVSHRWKNPDHRSNSTTFGYFTVKTDPDVGEAGAALRNRDAPAEPVVPVKQEPWVASADAALTEAEQRIRSETNAFLEAAWQTQPKAEPQ